MRKLTMLLLALGAVALAGCATDDTTASASDNAAPVAGAAPGPGIEPSMRGTSPGVKW